MMIENYYLSVSSQKRLLSKSPIVPKELDLSGFGPDDRETGGIMLNITGLNHFYYVRGFTGMRCKHSRVLSVIREPNDGQCLE